MTGTLFVDGTNGWKKPVVGVTVIQDNVGNPVLVMTVEHSVTNPVEDRTVDHDQGTEMELGVNVETQEEMTVAL